MKNAPTAHERLSEAIGNLRTSDGWQRWLITRKSFHHYSPNNQLLIATQRPYYMDDNDDPVITAEFASRVAGFTTWKQLGRQVIRRAKGLSILAPVVYKPKDATDPEERKITFKVVYVFDVSQTELIPGHEEIPFDPPSQPITGDTHQDWLDHLVQHAKDEALRVYVRDLSDNPAGGWYDRQHKKIVIDSTDPVNSQVRTLAHELAHHYGADYEDHGRKYAEVMADAVAWLFCDQIGLDVSANSVPYIAGWSEAAEDVIRDQVAWIDQTVKTLSDPENAKGAPGAPSAKEPVPATD